MAMGQRVRLLLAGPGTGKTTRIKSIIDAEFADAHNILVLSFTNATVNDLRRDLRQYTAIDCCTLHSYALRINPLGDRYVMDKKVELPIVEKLAKDLDVDFTFLCEILGCISFDAMVSECLRFLGANPAYSTEKVGTLDLLVVDEYQDFNEQERALIEAVSQHACETIILGDDDQSIYSFKDADPDGIIALYERQDVVHIPHEHMCHRCPDVVVKRATRLISHNRIRVEKPLNCTGKPGTVTQRQFMSQAAANEFIADEIAHLRAQSVPEPRPSILVLSSVSYYANDLAAILDEREIEYVNFWIPPIPDEDWVRLWQLRAIYGRKRVLNLVLLRRTLTPHFQGKVKEVLRGAVAKGFVSESVAGEIAPFYGDDFSGLLAEPPSLRVLVERHMEYAEIAARVDEANLAFSVESLVRNLGAPVQFEPGLVNIMSIHRSKGLQADAVFINGLVDGVLPNGADGLDTIEAQRRLLYVGVTRTLASLYLVSPVEWEGKYVHRLDKSQFAFDYRKKLWNGRASRFLDEMTR
jgi:superfamily I DNA/RNA helicase